MRDALTWENISWRRGEDQFSFEIERGGLFATLKAPGNRSMTLPMVVWDGLLEALKANRATKAKSEQMFPVRNGTRWYEGEAAELAQGFRSGRSIPALAKTHNRSEYAVENQLDKMGLFSKAEKYGPPGGNYKSRPATAAEEMDRELSDHGTAPMGACTGTMDWRAADHGASPPAGRQE
jgi:hypothetical protein